MLMVVVSMVVVGVVMPVAMGGGNETREKKSYVTNKWVPHKVSTLLWGPVRVEPKNTKKK